MHVFSAIPSYYKGWSPKVLDGTYASSSGTSMASPAVAGAVALYLEKYPKATLDSVRKDFLANTVTDNFTTSHGDLPNSAWGWGKLDIFKVMSDGIFYGVETPEGQASIYPNPANEFVAVDAEWQQLVISDMNGRVVKTLVQYQPRVDVSDLPQGTYLLQIQTGEAMLNKVLMVQ